MIPTIFLHHWPLASEIIPLPLCKRDGVPSGGSRATVLLRAGCFPASCLPSSSFKLHPRLQQSAPPFLCLFPASFPSTSSFRFPCFASISDTTFAARIDLTAFFFFFSPIVEAGGATCHLGRFSRQRGLSDSPEARLSFFSPSFWLQIFRFQTPGIYRLLTNQEPSSNSLQQASSSFLFFFSFSAKHPCPAIIAIPHDAQHLLSPQKGRQVQEGRPRRRRLGSAEAKVGRCLDTQDG